MSGVPQTHVHNQQQTQDPQRFNAGRPVRSTITHMELLIVFQAHLVRRASMRRDRA
jgi:hypothetical protein